MNQHYDDYDFADDIRGDYSNVMTGMGDMDAYRLVPASDAIRRTNLIVAVCVVGIAAGTFIALWGSGCE